MQHTGGASLALSRGPRSARRHLKSTALEGLDTLPISGDRAFWAQNMLPKSIRASPGLPEILDGGASELQKLSPWASDSVRELVQGPPGHFGFAKCLSVYCREPARPIEEVCDDPEYVQVT